MKVIQIFFVLIVSIFSFSAQALIIDTTSTWDGNINTGWLGSGQSFTVDATDTFFDDITFDFDSQSNGLTFSFTLSDSLNGGSTLFSDTFIVSGGKGFIDINQSLVANSTIYALIDYNGFSGSSAYFQTDVYAGGSSNFGADGSKANFLGIDHVFVANFTDSSGVSVPAPSALALFGLGLLGFVSMRQKA